MPHTALARLKDHFAGVPDSRKAAARLVEVYQKTLAGINQQGGLTLNHYNKAMQPAQGGEGEAYLPENVRTQYEQAHRFAVRWRSAQYNQRRLMEEYGNQAEIRIDFNLVFTRSLEACNRAG